MNKEDIILAILLLNEKKGRKLNEKGIKRIAEDVGVTIELEDLNELKARGLLNYDLALTDKGKREAEEALKNLEKEIAKGILGKIKWISFKSKLVPERIKGGCLGSPHE